MPLFEFSCRKCSTRFEALLFGNEEASCPKCRSKSLERLVSTFAAHGGGDSSSDSFGADFGGGADTGDAEDGPGGCGTCGDQRGPGSCAVN